MWYLNPLPLHLQAARCSLVIIPGLRSASWSRCSPGDRPEESVHICPSCPRCSLSHRGPHDEAHRDLPARRLRIACCACRLGWPPCRQHHADDSVTEADLRTAYHRLREVPGTFLYSYSLVRADSLVNSLRRGCSPTSRSGCQVLSSFGFGLSDLGLQADDVGGGPGVEGVGVDDLASGAVGCDEGRELAVLGVGVHHLRRNDLLDPGLDDHRVQDLRGLVRRVDPGPLGLAGLGVILDLDRLAEQDQLGRKSLRLLRRDLVTVVPKLLVTGFGRGGGRTLRGTTRTSATCHCTAPSVLLCSVLIVPSRLPKKPP